MGPFFDIFMAWTFLAANSSSREPNRAAIRATFMSAGLDMSHIVLEMKIILR